MNLDIVYEDKEMIVCYKPAGVATQTASLGSPDMVSMIKNYLAKEGKENASYVGVIHRLDQPVSGLLVFAKNKQAAADLSRQIQDGNANKDYLALCYGRPKEKAGTLEHYLCKDSRTKMAKVSEKEENSSYKKAVLDYEVEAEKEDCAILQVHLYTGRFHQIRSQFAFEGNPLLGDVKYATKECRELSMKKRINKIALCAYRLVLNHPKTGKKMEFTLEEKLLPNWYQISE